MESRIYGIVIKNNQVLSVQTRGYTVFPGGKPEKFESESDCLKREFGEELFGTEIEIGTHYRNFDSIDPRNDEPFLCKNYFVKIKKEVGEPSSEIEKSKWIDSSYLDILKFSDSSRKTLLSLMGDNLIK